MGVLSLGGVIINAATTRLVWKRSVRIEIEDCNHQIGWPEEELDRPGPNVHFGHKQYGGSLRAQATETETTSTSSDSLSA